MIPPRLVQKRRPQPQIPTRIRTFRQRTSIPVQLLLTAKKYGALPGISGKLHFQLYLDAAGAAPDCRDKPFLRQFPVDMPEVVSHITNSGICDRCWRRLPQDLRASLLRAGAEVELGLLG